MSATSKKRKGASSFVDSGLIFRDFGKDYLPEYWIISLDSESRNPTRKADVN